MTPTPQAHELPELPRSYGEHCVYDSVRVMREPGYTASQMRAYGQACYEAAMKASPVQEEAVGDWVMVPREPTGEMLDAMIAPWLDGKAKSHRQCLVEGWNGAIQSANPQPPAASVEGVEAQARVATCTTGSQSYSPTWSHRPMADNDATPCPLCDGRGGEVRQVCCGRGRSECCGEPDIDFEPCHACGGSGYLPIEDTKDGR